MSPTTHVYRWTDDGADEIGTVISVSPDQGRESNLPAISADGTRVAYAVSEPEIGMDGPDGVLADGDTYAFESMNPTFINVQNVGEGLLQVSSVTLTNPAFSVGGVPEPPPPAPPICFPNEAMARGDICTMQVLAPAPMLSPQSAFLMLDHNPAPSAMQTIINLVVPPSSALRPGLRPDPAPGAPPAGGSATPVRRPLAVPNQETNGVRDVYLTDLTNPATPTAQWVSERPAACPSGAPQCARNAKACPFRRRQHGGVDFDEPRVHRRGG